MSDEHLRNLPVPFYSQRKNEYIWHERYTDEKEAEKAGKKVGDCVPDGKKVSMACNSCNLTSLWMILRYYGVSIINPDAIMKEYFENPNNLEFLNKHPDAEAVEKWENIKDIADKIFSSYSFETKLKYDVSISSIHTEIEAGRPVLASIALAKNKNGSGHIVVIRGFAKIDGEEYIIINDPWGSPVSNNYIVGEQTTIYGGYYPKVADSSLDSMISNYSGDNAIIKLSSFKKQMMSNGKFSTVMTIKKQIMWNFPDGTEDFSEYEKRLANIYKKIEYSKGTFPLTSNNTWHDGLHLTGIGNIHSIGVGKVAAIRNCKTPPFQGDNSFILLQHQIVKNKEVKNFYSLYMHLKPVDIKEEIKKRVLKGELSEYIWLNQLTKNILPFRIILANLNKKEALGKSDTVEESDGLLSGKYQNIIFYDAEYDSSSNSFYKTDKVSDYKLGRRMLINPLPANNAKLMKMLLDPQEYEKEYFFKNMKKKENFIKNIDNLEYFFFMYKGDFLCVNLSETYFEKIAFNAMEFKVAITRLNKLYKGEIVFFNDDYKSSYTVNSNISEESEISCWQNENKSNYKNILSNELFSLNLVNKRETYLSKLDELYFLGSQSLKVSDLQNIKKAKNKYSEAYKTESIKLLKKELQSFEDVNSKKEGGTANEVETSCNIMKLKCNSIIENLNSIHQENKESLSNSLTTGISIIKEFINKIDSYSEISLIEKISIYEFLLLKLFSYPAEKIAKNSKGENDCFISKDSYYKPLIKEIENIYKKISEYLDPYSMKYVDMDLEIGKNELIGKCGKYDLRSQLHFEIFANNDILSFPRDKIIKDSDKDAYYNPQKCIEALKKVFEDSGVKDKLQYLDDGILTKKELQDLYKTGNAKPFLADYVFNHISQWSDEISKSTVKKSGFLGKKKFYIGDVSKDGDEKEARYVDFDSYFDKYHKKYMWMKKEFFDENKFKDGQVFVYHPLYFIEKLVALDIK